MNQQKFISFLQFQLPAIAWCLFIFTVSSIPSERLPAFVDYTDKLVHAGVFGILCWLLHVALYFQPNLKLRKWSMTIALGLTMVYGVSDEFHQMFTPGRTTDFLDFLADSTGGSIYILLNSYLKFYHYKENLSTTK